MALLDTLSDAAGEACQIIHFILDGVNTVSLRLSGNLLWGLLLSAAGQVSPRVLLTQSQGDATYQTQKPSCWLKHLIQKSILCCCGARTADLCDLIFQLLNLFAITSKLCFISFSWKVYKRQAQQCHWVAPTQRWDSSPDRLPFSCFLRWRSRLVCWPKQRSHKWHLKGFSLLWMLRTWRWRLDEMLNERSQYLHLAKENRRKWVKRTAQWHREWGLPFNQR